MTAAKKKQPIVHPLVERRRDQVTIAIDFDPDPYLIAEARRRGWKLLGVWFCGGRIYPWMNVKGALVSALPDSELVQNLHGIGCRIVRFGNFPHPMDDQLPAVVPDYAAYGQKAAEHFRERQFKHVAFVGRDPWHDMLPLYEGFSQRATGLGMTCNVLRYKESASAKMSGAEKYAYRQQQFADWLGDQPRPLGLFTHGDFGASEICLMTAQAGYDIPTDVAVLGMGRKRGICETSLPPLSSFADAMPPRIRAACDLLARLLRGESPPRTPVMIPPPGFIERQSTHVLAVSEPVVARALRFLWDHFNDPLTVNDVARATGVSRSKLDRLFRKHFPRGIKEELNRKRLEKCRQLLKDSNCGMTQIAAAAGFHSPDYLRQAFRKAFGVSPRQFRKEHRG